MIVSQGVLCGELLRCREGRCGAGIVCAAAVKADVSRHGNVAAEQGSGGEEVVVRDVTQAFRWFKGTVGCVGLKLN